MRRRKATFLGDRRRQRSVRRDSIRFRLQFPSASSLLCSSSAFVADYVAEYDVRAIEQDIARLLGRKPGGGPPAPPHAAIVPPPGSAHAGNGTAANASAAQLHPPAPPQLMTQPEPARPDSPVASNSLFSDDVEEADDTFVLPTSVEATAEAAAGHSSGATSDKPLDKAESTDRPKSRVAEYASQMPPRVEGQDAKGGPPRRAPKLPGKEALRALNASMLAMYDYLRPSAEELQKRLQLLSRLQQLVSQHWSPGMDCSLCISCLSFDRSFSPQSQRRNPCYTYSDPLRTSSASAQAISTSASLLQRKPASVRISSWSWEHC